MLIGIDGNEANVGEKVGVNQYAYEILWGLYELQDIKKRGHKVIIYLKNPPNSDLPPEKVFWKYKVIRGGKLWVMSRLTPELVRSQKLDVFFTPSHYLPPLSRSPKVCMIHDLGYLKFSDQFKKYDFWQLNIWSAISIIISKCIICPSKSTAKDIVRHYPFARNKVRVVHHGYDSMKFNTHIPGGIVRQVLNKYRIDKEYILFLSTLKPSKNVEGLLGAFAKLKLQKAIDDVKLVISGKKGWMYESIFSKVKNLGLEKEVVFTDYLPEDEKPALIAGAKVFVLPSYWEGFGMDVINAMACGTPVVVSKVASLPEVAGDAGIYIDPESQDSIVEGIQKVLKMSKVEYNRVVAAGLSQAQKFSWGKAAKKTLAVLETAVN